ncbi:MAG: universal stress protein [Proteobacteria bacterium]|nr:universal stress protein [Pseudomonadota bacterium]
MKKILCATDGSSHGDTAVRFAARLSKFENTPLTICTVNVLAGGLRGPQIYQHTDGEISKLLNDAAAVAKDAGVKAASVVELDAREIAPAVVSYAAKEGFDHIVTGTGDPRGVRRLVLGSVAASIAGSAECAVTVAR